MRGVAAPEAFGRSEAEREPRVQEQALFELTVQTLASWCMHGNGMEWVSLPICALLHRQLFCQYLYFGF